MAQDSRSSKVVSIHAKPKRRTFTADYKLRILEEVDRATEHGQITVILRREGLYSSQLSQWRDWRKRLENGEVQQTAKPSTAALRRENERLKRRTQQLEKKLKQATILIAMQKKLNETMDQLDLDEDEHKP